MDRVINFDDEFSKFYKRAEDIEECLRNFVKIKKHHPKVYFAYGDVLERTSYTYSKGYVPANCVFDGQTYITPFTELERACNIIVRKDGNREPYPKNIKVGNKAIGQAWLQDGAEVFSPRHALTHSMQSTALMLRTWAICFQERI